MAWSRLAPWLAAYEAGMLCAATATIDSMAISQWLATDDDGTAVTMPTLCGFAEPDELFIESNTQHTRYLIEFPTEQWPGLVVGDAVVINADTYTVKTMPALQRTGWFSICELTRATRSYPKNSIDFSNNSILREDGGHVLRE